MKNSPTEGIHPAYNRPPSLLERAIGRRFDKEPMPRIELHMVFAPHGSSEDAALLEKEVTQADIVLLEGPGFNNPVLVDLVNDFAAGKVDPAIYEGRMRGIEGDDKGGLDWTFSVFKMLYATGKDKTKGIAFLEAPAEPEEAMQVKKVVLELKSYAETLYGSHASYEDAFQEYERRLDAFAHHIVGERDAYAVKAIKPSLEKLLKKNPDIRKRKPIRVCLFFGSAHTGISHGVKLGGRDALHPMATRTVRGISTFIEYELVRKKAWRKAVNPELLRKGFVEAFVVDYTHYVFKDVPEFAALRTQGAFTRALVDAYSEEEAKHLYGLIAEGDSRREEAVALMRAKAEPVFQRFLEKK